MTMAVAEASAVLPIDALLGATSVATGDNFDAMVVSEPAKCGDLEELSPVAQNVNTANGLLTMVDEISRFKHDIVSANSDVQRSLVVAAQKTENFHCVNCKKATDKPLRCSVCKKVSYCSQQCQKSDWRFHKWNCSPAAAVKPDEAKRVRDVSREADQSDTDSQEEFSSFSSADLEKLAQQAMAEAPGDKERRFQEFYQAYCSS